MANLFNTDPEIYAIINQESKRLEEEINLIASENYVAPEVMEATGSILTNKYAEGYPGKRYYAGCQYVDMAENLARERAKKLFGAEHVNVQPHAGSQANMAAYFAVLKPGDTILGMSLAEGGHLTHGHGVNFSGKFYNSIQYKVNRDTEMLDYEEIAALAEQHKPKLIVAGASAYSRIIDFEKLAAIAKQNNALLMADIAHIAGLVAADLHPTPIGHADITTTTTHKTLRGPRGGMIMCTNSLAESVDKAIMPGTQGGPLMHVIAAKAVAFNLALQPEFITYQKQVLANAKAMAQTFQDLGYRITTGGTDNHLFVIDLRSKNMNGKVAEIAMQSVGIIANRNCVPFETEKPWITSGIRIGTPAITTRGMKEKDAQQIAHYIDEALQHRDDAAALQRIKDQVHAMCKRFPIY
ncbi:MAG: serine hydroxymethyltransferase [Candidatus Dependentiae bacterium]|nr:serine hydroxymethyltransferase [Candidatus Dependentiae bacterium]